MKIGQQKVEYVHLKHFYMNGVNMRCVGYKNLFRKKSWAYQQLGAVASFGRFKLGSTLSAGRDCLVHQSIGTNFFINQLNIQSISLIFSNNHNAWRIKCNIQAIHILIDQSPLFLFLSHFIIFHLIARCSLLQQINKYNRSKMNCNDISFVIFHRTSFTLKAHLPINIQTSFC